MKYLYFLYTYIARHLYAFRCFVSDCISSQFLGHSLFSRITPVETALFGWNLLILLLVVSRVDFTVFVRFLEAVGVRKYCTRAVESGWQLCASRFLREQRLDEPLSQRFGGFGLIRKRPKLLSWSCTQPRATKATAAAAVRFWLHGIDTARCCRHVLKAARGRN